MGKKPAIDSKVEALHQYLLAKRDVDVTPNLSRFDEIIKTDPETLNGIYSYLKDQPDTDVSDTFEGFQEALLPKKKELATPSGNGAQAATPESNPIPSFTDLYQEQSLLKAQNEQQGLSTLPSGLTEEQDKQRTLNELNSTPLDQSIQNLKDHAGALNGEQPKKDAGFFESLWETVKSGLSDQLPKEYFTQRLRMSKGTLGDVFDTRSDINQFGDQLETLGVSREEYDKWKNKQPDKIKQTSDDEKAKAFLTEKFGEKGYEELKQKFETQNQAQRLGFEKEVQQQDQEARDKTGNVVQDLREINSGQKLLSFLGNAVGQGLYRIPYSILTGTTGSIVSESSAIYDRQLDLIKEKTGKSREQIIKEGLDKPAAGQALSVLAGAMDAVSAGGVLGLFRKAASKQLTNSLLKEVPKQFVKGGVFEGLTEGAQGEIEEKAAAGGAGTEYKADAWRIANGFVSGFVAGGALSTISPEHNVEPKVQPNASDLRSNTQQEPQGGNVIEGSQNQGGKDLQLAEEKTIPQGEGVGAIEQPSQNTSESNLQPSKSEEVTAFVERIKKGEKMDSPEDIQFYENNKKQIEAELQQSEAPKETPNDEIQTPPVESGKGGTETTATEAVKEEALPVQENKEEQKQVKPKKEKEVSEKSKSEEEPVISKIEKLNENESQGYNVVRNRELKEAMLQNPEKAKVAFDIMDAASKTWGKDLSEDFKKHPLAHLSQFFYGDANSVEEWTDLQIKGEEQNIESDEKYIASLNPKKKGDQKSIKFYEDKIQSAKERISKYQSLKESTLKSQTNEHETGKRIPVQEGIGENPTEGGTERTVSERNNGGSGTEEVRESEVPKPSEESKGEGKRKKGASVGDHVSFEWLGDTKKGEIISVEGDKAKIKSGKTTYSADVSSINSNYEGEQASTNKYYEPPIASPTKKKPGQRIPASPIYGAEVKQIKQILIDLSKSIPTKIYFTRKPTPRRKSLGSYSPRASVIAIKFSNDLDTTAHELGHAIDDFYDVLGNADDKVKTELKELSKFGSKPPSGHPSPKEYVLGEGVAEYIRAYLVNPKETENQFPATSALFKSLLAKETLDNITEFGNDIRKYAGLSGHDQVMSNVQFEPENNKSWWTQLVTKSSKENFELTIWDRLNQKWINSMFPFDKAVAWLLDKKNVADLEPSKNPIMLARLLNGNSEKVQDILKNGFLDEVKSSANGGFEAVRQVDAKTKKPMSLEWLLDPLDNTSVQSILDEQKEVISYMIAGRTLELEKKLDRSDILTGIGAGIFQDVAVAKKRLDEFDRLPTKKKKRIEEAARRYREYSKTVLQYAVDKGRLAKESFDEITQSNLEYVALQRLSEAGPEEPIAGIKKKGGQSIGAAKEIIRKIKGSAKTIKNPYQSLIENTVSTVREADRNEVMQSFRELLVSERKMREGEPMDLGKVGHQVAKGTPNSITVFVDGSPEYWQLDEDVYKAVKNITDSGYKIPGFFTALPRLLRWTVTNFPVFAIRNRIRDFQHRFVITNTGAFTGFDIHTKKGLKEANKEAFQQFGGGQAGYYLLDHEFYNHELRKAISHLADDKTVTISTPEKLRQVLDDKYHWYHNLISKGETATRLEEYRSAFKKAKEKGMDDYNASVFAAYQARDLMDFAVAGEYARVMNQVLPFTNAAIRGLDKSVRSARQNPKGFAARFVLYSVIPTILTRMLVHLLDKDKEYEEMPDWRRDMFYNIPMGPDQWLVIPKSFEIGTLASGTDRLMSYQLFDDKNAFKGYGGSLAQSTLPVSLDDMAGPYRNIVGVMTNYDFFTKKNIIPTYETGKALELRHTDKASRIGKVLSPLIQVDPRYIDYLVKSNLSYFGHFALKVSDLGREDSRNKFGLTDTGLVRNDPVYESKTVQEFLDFQKKYGIPYNHPMVREFDYMMRKYFEEKDVDRRKEASRNLIIFAKTSLKYLEDHKEQLIKKYSRKK